MGTNPVLYGILMYSSNFYQVKVYKKTFQSRVQLAIAMVFRFTEVLDRIA